MQPSLLFQGSLAFMSLVFGITSFVLTFILGRFSRFIEYRVRTLFQCSLDSSQLYFIPRTVACWLVARECVAV
jgi:hypothetical protein